MLNIYKYQQISISHTTPFMMFSFTNYFELRDVTKSGYRFQSLPNKNHIRCLKIIDHE